MELDLALFTESSALDVDLRDYASFGTESDLVLTLATGDSPTLAGITRINPILEDVTIA